MLTVHHLNNSRSQRVLWMLEELEVPYEIAKYERDKVTNLAPAALKAVHPLGKSPVITDGDATIAETGAIVSYLLEKYGNGRLAGSDPHALTYWLHYAEGSAMPPLVMKLVFTRTAEKTPALLRPLARKIVTGALAGYIDPQISLHAGYWEEALAGTGWFAGSEMSAADIMMSFPLEAAAMRGGVGPKARDFLARIHTRPAYQHALEKGGPYAFA
ncbi:glutathione S-transferase family protein [Pseudokordiimonas caeni]|uniref:glutathione S-transferase family protein n=1 Tax=Pseudokordiimonas caeni TaxID=2997908 RepID=UPI002811824F|nr:glutathione S-transferase [Pseudokordiimonas caeni]